MKTRTLELRVEILDSTELSDEERQLLARAREASMSSYAPYSNFHVGAAALLSDGTVVPGSNQENAAFPSGLCAERTALFAAAAGHPGMAIRCLAIAAQTNGTFTDSPVTPCGACRQVMLGMEERQNTPISLLLYGSREIYRIASVRMLLPLQFHDASMHREE